MIDEDLGSSTRKIADTLNVSYWTVLKIKDNPYHIQRLQASADFRPRIALSMNFANFSSNPSISDTDFFTHEASL